jgi:hypothetical protein
MIGYLKYVMAVSVIIHNYRTASPNIIKNIINTVSAFYAKTAANKKYINIVPSKISTLIFLFNW